MNITVVGAAKSGISAALLANSQKHNVFVTESKSIENYKENSLILENNNIEFEFGKNSERALNNCDLIITSPGVPPSSEIIKSAEKKGVPIISEIDYASKFLKNPIIAITGTNGKTTTTALTEYIFNKSGRKAIAAGNIGTPLSSLVNKIDKDTVIVAELSSYQLDRISSFKPDVATILNITPDHLGYHGSFENYIFAKWKISSYMNEKNLLILNIDDDTISAGNYKSNADIVKLSMSAVDRGICSINGKIIIKLHKEEELMSLSELGLPGVHNAYNSMAAALSARAFEIRNENIRDALMTFKGVEHRLEFVRNLNGVSFVNDSKATNINACWFALSSYQKPIIWIAGGRGDANDYSSLDKLVENNVKAIVSIGEESEAIFNHFCTKKSVFKTASLDDAVTKAYMLADEDDVVLFSPACKSFDMFLNFEHRGEVFKEIVNNL